LYCVRNSTSIYLLYDGSFRNMTLKTREGKISLKGATANRHVKPLKSDGGKVKLMTLFIPRKMKRNEKI